MRGLRVGVGGDDRRGLVAHPHVAAAAVAHEVVGELEVAAPEQPEQRAVAEPRERLGHQPVDRRIRQEAPSQITSSSFGGFSITLYWTA